MIQHHYPNYGKIDRNGKDRLFGISIAILCIILLITGLVLLVRTLKIEEGIQTMSLLQRDGTGLLEDGCHSSVIKVLLLRDILELEKEVIGV